MRDERGKDLREMMTRETEEKMQKQHHQGKKRERFPLTKTRQGSHRKDGKVAFNLPRLFSNDSFGMKIDQETGLKSMGGEDDDGKDQRN